MMQKYLYIATIGMLLIAACMPVSSYAQFEGISWSSPVNLSNSPDATSTDPFLLPDPSGGVHLFWAEKMGPDPTSMQADTIMYSYWDGSSWSRPVDLFFSSEVDNIPVATYPRAVLDETGRIHLFWMTEDSYPNFTLKYSSVNAWEAGTALAWDEPFVVADDLVGTKYSYDVAYNPVQGLHLVFVRNVGGQSATTENTISHIHSDDRGLTWSSPVNMHTIQQLDRGGSDVRLLLEEPDRLYTSWTEWDSTGNGQAIYFQRSLNNGQSWDQSIVLDVRRGDEYERDWNNMALIGHQQLVAIWEGGWRAYRHAQYSYDGGLTWSDPIDTFPWLIGDNGAVQFVKDSADRLHVFVANRIREGNLNRTGDGLWHSIWEGGMRWQEPILAQGDEKYVSGMTNPKIAITNGNQIVAVWYGSKVDEIMVATGVVNDAPELPSQPWPVQTIGTPVTPEPLDIPATPTPEATSHALLIDPSLPPTNTPVNPFTGILIGIIPALAIVSVIFFVVQQKQRVR